MNVPDLQTEPCKNCGAPVIHDIYDTWKVTITQDSVLWEAHELEDCVKRLHDAFTEFKNRYIARFGEL